MDGNHGPCSWPSAVHVSVGLEALELLSCLCFLLDSSHGTARFPQLTPLTVLSMSGDVAIAAAAAAA